MSKKNTYVILNTVEKVNRGVISLILLGLDRIIELFFNFFGDLIFIIFHCLLYANVSCDHPFFELNHPIAFRKSGG